MESMIKSNSSFTPIHNKDVKETINTEVLVLGGGISGLTAALSAAEKGANTILIEKSNSINFRGLHNAAINSCLQKREGIINDRDQIISTIMEWGSYKADQKVVTLWANNCDSVMDWLIEMAEKADIEVHLDPTTKSWYFPNYAVAHMFWTKDPNRLKAQGALAEMLLSNGKKMGVQYHFNSAAVRLLREGKRSRVTGAIVNCKERGYIQIDAKAVILCTGDYGGNHELINKYCNGNEEILSLKCEYDPEVNTGDGHRIGMWVGAAIDDPPHCPMMFDFAVFSKHGLFNLARQPWLYVNINGERFMNEDLPYSYESNQILRQPGKRAWSIWDDKYEDEWPKMKSQCCKNMGPPLYRWGTELLENALRNENVLVASTLDELAKKMEIPVDPFLDTTNRYNALAENGKDLDFGKHSDRLTTLTKAPYYACKMEVRRMVILNGLKINHKLEVLDTEGDIIPGFYAAGNASGSFFGGTNYPTTIPGLTHSRAWTFGRLAGIFAAAYEPHI